jgi:hypothetical protein
VIALPLYAAVWTARRLLVDPQRESIVAATRIVMRTIAKLVLLFGLVIGVT